MASTIDKMWITSDLLDSATYRDGIGEFIRYLITNKVSGLKCPCRKCRNKKYVNSKDDMTVHLLRSGMDKSYTVWVHHGEVVQTPQQLVTQQSVVETTSICSNADTIGEDSDDNGHMGEAAQSSSIPRKTKETKYDGLKRKAKQPLYPSSKHSTMDALVMSHEVDPSVGPRSSTVVTEASSNDVNPSNPKKLKFNNAGLKYGEASSQAASLLGKLSRKHLSIKYHEFKDIPVEAKDAVWEAYKKEYNFSDAQRKLEMRYVNAAWRRLKTTLRNKYLPLKDSCAIWISNMPQESSIKPEDWEVFCRNEDTPKARHCRVRAKQNRLASSRVSTHNTGRLGYARFEDKLNQRGGSKVTLSELWLEAHKRKDGQFAPEHQEKAKFLEYLIREMIEKGESETLDTGPLFTVFGLDKGGVSRCVGRIPKSWLRIQAFPLEMLSEANAKAVDSSFWQNNYASLDEKFTQLVEALKARAYPTCDADVPSSSTANHQGQTTLSQHTQPRAFEGSRDCYINNMALEPVAVGRRTASGGAPEEVNGHALTSKECKVVLNKILKPNAIVYCRQASWVKVRDIPIGATLFWHEDFVEDIVENLAD